ncbi:N-acetyltransferase family protein [Ornithinibacillus sp. 179-J 7C1 HS]|uniref:GNAT family N-acetyltransferase n=1 Tax=Ornithinibacillus sp. 179-J 7C1 HS TaxID=3142384 RepID=UPI0039A3C524
MKVREAIPNDAKKLAELILQVEASSEYMLWEPYERQISPDSQQKMIERLQESENSTILIAEHEEQLVGYLFAIGEDAKRKKHSAYLVVGIHQDYRGKGVGSLLFETLNQWAKEQKLHRLELTVVTENEAGVSLYKKMGFEVEGTKIDSLYVNGSYLNEYYMAKIL